MCMELLPIILGVSEQKGSDVCSLQLTPELESIEEQHLLVLAQEFG